MELLILLMIPLLATASSWFITRADIRDTVMVILAGALLYQAYGVYVGFQQGVQFNYTFVTLLPGLALQFVLEPLGMLFILIVSFLWLITSLYAIGYMRANHEEHQNRFFAFFCFSIFAVIGVALSANLLTLFVFYEVLTLSTYPLVTHAGNDEARLGGRKYLTILLGTSISFLLPAIVVTYMATGTLDFRSGGILENVSPVLSGLLLFLFMFGIGKAALMPFHRWLPAAMVAPTPVSALLHAVAVVKAGVFSVVKVIVYIFGADYLSRISGESILQGGWLVYVAGISVVVASLIALRQDNLKKRLAYSTVSQLSYVTMAAAILAPKSLVAAGFHIAAHAFGKITLFFAAGNIATALHKKKVSELSGVGRKMPITIGAFAIGALSMIGIPPAAGFLTKWYMLQGALATEQYFVIMVLLISTVLNAYYLLPIVIKAFFDPLPKNERRKALKEAPWQMVVAITATATATIYLFFDPDAALSLASQMIK